MKRTLLAVTAVLSAFLADGSLKVEVRSNRADQRYYCGEEAVFTVSVKGEDSKLLSAGIIDVTLDRFAPGSVISRSTVDLSEANPFKVKGKLDEPGFLRLSMTSSLKDFPKVPFAKNFFTAVTYEMEKVRSTAAFPPGFDGFWMKAKAEAEKIPLDAKVEIDEKFSDDEWNAWRVSFATVSGRRVYGWLTKEKSAKGKLPARVSVGAAGFGDWSQNPVRTPGHVTLFLTVFPFEPCRPDSREKYLKFSADLKKRCSVGSYEYAGFSSDNPKDVFYYPVILGNNRAIEWLAKRDDVDAANITYIGTSQGGGLGLAAAALSKRIKRAVFHVPEVFEEQAKGGSKSALYFSGKNFASRIRIPVYVTAGTSDAACPLPSVVAAFNAIACKNKILRMGFGMTHFVWPHYYSDSERWLDDDGKENPAFAKLRRAPKTGVGAPGPREWWKRAADYRAKEARRLRDADVVWIGDSITHYFESGEKKKAIWDRYFGEPVEPGFFAKLFGAKAEKAPYLGLNFGIEGDFTAQVIHRVNNALGKTCPKVIVLNIGTNDSGYKRHPEDTAKNIKHILYLIRCQQPQAKVLLYAIFPRGKIGDACRERNEAVNAMIRKFCDGKMVFFCDIRDALMNNDGSVNIGYLEDGLHLSPAGHELWADDAFARIERICRNWTEKDERSYWRRFGWRAYLELNPAEQRKSLEELEKLGVKRSGRVAENVKMFDDFKRFPKDEKDIKFPASLADLGVADTNVVTASSFGWNPTNATKCLQAAIDSGATTVVITPEKGPWHIDSVKLRSNLRILVKKGAKVIKDKYSPVRDKVPLFALKKCENVIIEGEGTSVDESYVGGYLNYAERRAWCKYYGSSVIHLVETKNVVIRNLRIAESAEDGIFTGGLGTPNFDTYVDNVVIDSHYRQAMSICNSDGMYCRKVHFLNTRGAAPSAGIDFEPPYEIAPNTGVYLFDCVFDNNDGGGLMFATSTYAPITVHAKRTKFKRHPSSLVYFMPRLGIYLGNGVKPPFMTLFEDCEFETYRDKPAIDIMCGPLFDFELRNCVIRQTKEISSPLSRQVASPIRFSLNRKFNDDGLDPELVGVGTFDNVVCEGYPEGTSAVEVSDELGLLPIKGALKGSIEMNGETIELDDFVYEAPDMNELPPALVDLSKLHSVPGAAESDDRIDLSFAGAWWQPLPKYNYLFKGKKGDEVSAKLVYPAWLKAVAGEKLLLENAKRKKIVIAKLQPGENEISFTVPEDGWYRIFPPHQRGEGGGVKFKDVKGAHFAYQSDTAEYGMIKFFNPDPKKDYVCYFEVPAGGKECRIRLSWGTVELRDGAGNVIERVRQGEYLGRHEFIVKPSTDKAEIWSLRSPAGSGITVLKFYRPMTGILADSIASLPCEYEEHFVPAKKPAPPADISWGDEVKVSFDVTKSLVDRSKLSPGDIEKLDAAISARKKLAAEAEWTGRLKKEEALLESMRKTAKSDGALHDIEMGSLNIPPLKEMASVEETAKSENANVLELSAFCNAFKNRLVPTCDRVALKGELFRFGLKMTQNTDDIVYDDVKKLVLLRDAIMKKTEQKGK